MTGTREQRERPSRSAATFCSAAWSSSRLSFAGALSNCRPEISLGQALAFLDALPGAVEQGLKARRAPEHEPLQVVVIEGNQQHGNGLAVARNDDGTVGATFVQK